MQISLALHSSPRFSTWLWFNDWKVLIDAGDGASQSLGYKIRKIDTVLLSHSHRDHIGGLLQVINQRGEAGPFTLAHPARGKSWNALESFSLRFNPGSSRHAAWHALEEGDWIETGVEGRLIRSFRTRHYQDDTDLNQAPRSLGYQLIWRKMKVKPEFQTLSQAQLDEVRLKIGREGITQARDEKIVTVSGDTQPISPEIAAGSQLLLHEATFLKSEDYDSEEAGEDVGHVHSTVEEALLVAKEAEVPNVVLYHVSTRYSDQEIREGVREIAEKLGVKSRVWAAFPRKVYTDFWREKPIWEDS